MFDNGEGIGRFSLWFWCWLRLWLRFSQFTFNRNSFFQFRLNFFNLGQDRFLYHYLFLYLFSRFQGHCGGNGRFLHHGHRRHRYIVGKLTHHAL